MYLEELARKRDAKYRQSSPDKAKEKAIRYSEKHPDREQARWRRYRQENPDMIKAKKHRREVRKRGNGGSFSSVEWQALKADHDYRCLCCGKTEEQIITEQGYGLTPDHVLPIAKGGTGDIENIQPLCKLCNSRKSDKTIDYRKGGQCN